MRFVFMFMFDRCLCVLHFSASFVLGQQPEKDFERHFRLLLGGMLLKKQPKMWLSLFLHAVYIT